MWVRPLPAWVPWSAHLDCASGPVSPLCAGRHPCNPAPPAAPASASGLPWAVPGEPGIRTLSLASSKGASNDSPVGPTVLTAPPGQGMQHGHLSSSSQAPGKAAQARWRQVGERGG